MLFNSVEYVVFLAVIAILYGLANRMRLLPYRNVFLLLASYYFYAQFHWWFVLLLFYVTGVNYGCGRWLTTLKAKGTSGKKAVTAAVLLSIGCLIFYKYAYLAYPSILLPIGLSFFTFQSLSYTIDLYRGKIQEERNFINFALFVAFFPTLLSGPIERARNMLPQLQAPTLMNWNSITQGAGLFIWGLFKKVVIADRLAEFVNAAYLVPEQSSGSTLALAAVCYSFQIYCDFSGYADMAIASGKILGFQIMQNFNFPYYVNTVKEFWRRWHISLTSWFTEYVYISLGGNRVNKARWLLNISAVFLLSGIWHGATWSFILWGALHAMLYLLEYYGGPKRPNVLYHLLVFIGVTVAWIFFRIEQIDVAWAVLAKIVTDIASPIAWGSSTFSTLLTMALLAAFLIREYLLFKAWLPQKHSVEYVLLLMMIALFGVTSDQFVYFQF